MTTYEIQITELDNAIAECDRISTELRQLQADIEARFDAMIATIDARHAK